MLEDEYYSEEEELSEEEALLSFREQAMIDKEDILNRIHWEKFDWQRKSQRDAKHSAAFYGVILSLLDRFEKRVKKAVLFDAPDGWWAYTFDIDSKGITLLLEHYSGYSCQEDGVVVGDVIDETYELIKVKSKRLTVEEYAKIYEVEQGTVRQWIRRGKIRTAIKVGKEWRIPELTELPGRGYKYGQYRWSEKLPDLPEEYDFISDYSYASFQQDSTDKNLFIITFSGGGPQDHKVMQYDAKEKERLELLLISHPLVEFISDHIGNCS